MTSSLRYTYYDVIVKGLRNHLIEPFKVKVL